MQNTIIYSAFSIVQILLCSGTTKELLLLFKKKHPVTLFHIDRINVHAIKLISLILSNLISIRYVCTYAFASISIELNPKSLDCFPTLTNTHTPMHFLVCSHTHTRTHMLFKLAMRNLRRLTNTLQYHRQLTSRSETTDTFRYPNHIAQVAIVNDSRRLSLKSGEIPKHGQGSQTAPSRIYPIHIGAPNCQRSRRNKGNRRLSCSYASLGRMQATPSEDAQPQDPLKSFERDFCDLPPYQVSTLSESGGRKHTLTLENNIFLNKCTFLSKKLSNVKITKYPKSFVIFLYIWFKLP